MSMLTMSPAERRDFLTEPHLAVLTVQRPDGRPPLATPVWFVLDDDGTLAVNVAAGSEKVVLLERYRTASLCISDEQAPYRFVTVGGTVDVGPADEAVRRRIASRYVPAEMLDGYLASTAGAPMRIVRVTPTSWHSNDFGQIPTG